MSVDQSNPFIKPVLIIAAIAALGLGLFVGIQQNPTEPQSAPLPTVNGVIFPVPRKVADLPLQFAKYGEHSIDKLRGRWSLVFLGFTQCPDVCPMTLHMIKKAKQSIQPEPDINVLLLSVDPHRDTPQKLGEYIDYFDPDFYAATAPLETLKAVTQSLATVFNTPENPESDDYSVDHSSAIILLNPNAEFQGVLSAPHTIASLRKDIQAITSL